MRSRLIAALIVCGCWDGARVLPISAQSHASASRLVQELQSEKTTDQARARLLQLGEHDANVRRYLAVHLPGMIQAGPDSCSRSDIEDLDARWRACPWYNAVELAGNLKIAEAAQALGPWITTRTTPVVIGLSSEARLDPYPVATALWQIGNPAVPTVQHFLASGPLGPPYPGSHAVALRVLCIIDTPDAKAALRNDLQHESEPELQAMIRRALAEK